MKRKIIMVACILSITRFMAAAQLSPQTINEYLSSPAFKTSRYARDEPCLKLFYSTLHYRPAWIGDANQNNLFQLADLISSSDTLALDPLRYPLDHVLRGRHAMV